MFVLVGDDAGWNQLMTNDDTQIYSLQVRKLVLRKGGKMLSIQTYGVIDETFNSGQLIQLLNHPADAWRWSVGSCTSRRLRSKSENVLGQIQVRHWRLFFWTCKHQMLSFSRCLLNVKDHKFGYHFNMEVKLLPDLKLNMYWFENNNTLALLY